MPELVAQALGVELAFSYRPRLPGIDTGLAAAQARLT